MAFPREHWTKLCTNNMLERIMREIHRRPRVVGNFPDKRSVLMLVAARLRHIAGTKWGTKRYLDKERLREQEVEERTAQTASLPKSDLGFPSGESRKLRLPYQL